MIKSFLQSQGWEKFQNSAGHQTFRVDGALLIKKNLPLGKNYLYAPRIELRINNSELIIFFNKIKELAKKENCIFLRIEPIDKLQAANYKLRKVADVQPSTTIILDLKKSEEELLRDMHQKTRYNIRLAEKKGVKIVESNDIDKFWQLMSETTERDGFRAHEKQYYAKMLKVNGEIALPTGRQARSVSLQGNNDKFEIKLYSAEYENKILAAGIFIFYNDTVTYLHGASTHEYKNIMAPYALHWHMIKLAKQKGFKCYDFYGIDEKKWPGVTRFKKGFGGKTFGFPGTYDMVFSNAWYLLYKIIRIIRRLI